MNRKTVVATSCTCAVVVMLSIMSWGRMPEIHQEDGAAKDHAGAVPSEELKKQREVFVKAAEEYAKAVSGGDAAYYQRAFEYAAGGLKALGAPVGPGRAARGARTAMPGMQVPAPASGVPTSPFAQAARRRLGKGLREPKHQERPGMVEKPAATDPRGSRTHLRRGGG